MGGGVRDLRPVPGGIGLQLGRGHAKAVEGQGQVHAQAIVGSVADIAGRVKDPGRAGGGSGDEDRGAVHHIGQAGMAE